MKYETLEIIADGPIISESEWLFVHSPCIIIHNGLTGEIYEYNMETEEVRECQEE